MSSMPKRLLHVPQSARDSLDRKMKRVAASEPNPVLADGQTFLDWLKTEDDGEDAETQDEPPAPMTEQRAKEEVARRKGKGDEDDREYSEEEMKAWFASIPVWELDMEIKDTDPDPSPKPGAVRLRRYWTRGKGAAKIRWGVSGDFNRCVAQLSKYVGPRAKGLCNVYHRSATGSAPGKGPHVG